MILAVLLSPGSLSSLDTVDRWAWRYGQAQT